MGQRTIEHLLNELRRLDAAVAPKDRKLSSALAALERYRLSRETGGVLSDAEWVGILLSGRDLLDSGNSKSEIAREVIELAIQGSMNKQHGATHSGSAAS